MHGLSSLLRVNLYLHLIDYFHINIFLLSHCTYLQTEKISNSRFSFFCFASFCFGFDFGCFVDLKQEYDLFFTHTSLLKGKKKAVKVSG
jgi:hypothetical protein